MNEESSEVLGQEDQAEQTGQVFAGPGAKQDRTPFRLSRLSSSQHDAVQRAKNYAMEQNIKTVLVKQTIVHQQQQMQSMQNALQRQQAWSLMCRIYVGSINFEIKEDTVQQAFLPFGPMKSFHLAYDQHANKHKGFSFIEYETPEAASLALEQMNGVVLGGRNIKVGRPSNMPQAQAIIENYLLEAQKFHRIYVSSIHPELTESDLKSVFEAFGKVVSCKMPHDAMRPGKHKGYAFLQYDNGQSANDAVSSMNLFDLGGQYIRVGKAVTPPNVNLGSTTTAPMPTATAVAAAAITAKITALDAASQNSAIVPPKPMLTVGSSFAAQPTIPTVSFPIVTSVPCLPAPSVAVTLPDVVLGTMPSVTTASATSQDIAMTSSVLTSAVTLPKRLSEEDFDSDRGKQMKQLESHVIILRNMVGKEDIDDDLEDEVREECSKYGAVYNIVVQIEQRSPPKGDANEDEEDNDEVIIFVEFDSNSASEKAVSSLNGRFFGGREVNAQLYSEELYRRNCFT